MRAAIATHELLPKGLDLQSLSIETGRVSICVSSGIRRSVCPLCDRASSRVHSRYTRKDYKRSLLRRTPLWRSSQNLPSTHSGE
jgi:hypothetical protein